MAVDEEVVLPTVVVEVYESITPADLIPWSGSDGRGYRGVGEVGAVVVAVEGCVFIIEVEMSSEVRPV